MLQFEPESLDPVYKSHPPPPNCRSCVKVEVDVLGLSVLTSLLVSVDVKNY